MNIMFFFTPIGGDAHSAYHIARLLQKYAEKKLVIYVLREAKSAATLLACGADEIIFSEISELGPMDPQIREQRVDQRFSPLAIKHTLELLAGESAKGHKEIVEALSEKLPPPLILGEHLKSLETGKIYLRNLLAARMLGGDEKRAEVIAQQLVEGYPDHGFCIDFGEAKNLGLMVKNPDEQISGEIYAIMVAYRKAWKEFDRLFESEDSENRPKALDIYRGMRRLAAEVIDEQLEKEKLSVSDDSTASDTAPRSS